jgi:hypothetical protein
VLARSYPPPPPPRTRGKDSDKRQRAAVEGFAKANGYEIVAKLKAARARKRKATGRCEGNKPLAETRPEVVAAVRELSATMSYRQISATLAERGLLTRNGKPFAASQIQRILAE